MCRLQIAGPKAVGAAGVIIWGGGADPGNKSLVRHPHKALTILQ